MLAYPIESTDLCTLYFTENNSSYILLLNKDTGYIAVYEHSLTFDSKKKELEFQIKLRVELEIDNGSIIDFDIHSSFTNNLSEKIILCDTDSMYVLNCQTKKLSKVKEAQIENLYYID